MTAASRSPTSPDLLLGRTVGTHYVVQQLLGRGRRSVTYQAEHRALHSRVVVKLLDVSWSGDAEAVARFEAAARSLSTMEAPNVAAVIDFGRESGRGVFVVNEYIDGESLEKLLDRLGPLPVDLFVPIAAQILKGIGAAHLRGIFHLDLKPQNLMICRDGDRGQVKILDLGLVQLFQGHVNDADAPVAGAPAYQAPEQITQRPLDARTDVYALGCIFFRMLAGRPPFTGTDAQVLYSQVNDDAPEIVDLLSTAVDVPEDLVELLRDCLNKDPDARPVDANEIVERLIDSVPAALFRVPVPAPGAGEVGARALPPGLAAMQSARSGEASAPKAPAPPPPPPPRVQPLTTSVDEPADESSSMRRVAPVIGTLSISEPSAARSGWEMRAEGAAPAEEDKARKGGGGLVIAALVLVLGGVVAVYLLRPDLLGLAPKGPATGASMVGEPTKLPAPATPGGSAGVAAASAGAGESAGVAAASAGAGESAGVAAASAGAGESAGVAAAGEGASAGEAGASAGEAGEAGASAGEAGEAGASAGEAGASAGEAGASAGEAGEAGASAGESAGSGAASGGEAVEAPAVTPVAVEFKGPAGAKVLIGGKEQGALPAPIALPPGEHAVRIEAKGYLPWEQKVTVSAGMKPVQVKMKRRPSGGDPINYDFDEEAGVPTSVQLKK